MQDLNHQLEQARLTFGRFLRNWRKGNGWVITTPQDWAKACPELIPPGFRVSSGQWANLENGKVQQAQPSTFIQLALLNQALAGDDRGAIADALLRERVNAAQPVLLPDGTPWAAEHWFACFIGRLRGPEPLWPPEGAEQLRERFASLVEQRGLRPATAMVQVLKLAGEMPPGQQAAIEAALLEGEPLEGLEADAALELLDRWETSPLHGRRPPGP